MRDEWSEDALRSEAIDGQIVIDVGSSFIDTLGYDLNTNVLIVSFVDGDPKAYMNRTFEQFKAFVNCTSKGAHYNQYYRGR